MAKVFSVRQRNSGSLVPPQVQGLAANAVSQSEIDLSWTQLPGVSSYTIRRGGVAIATGVAGNLYQDTGLAASTSYSYTVSAINQYGEGLQSAPSASTTQAAPTKPSAGFKYHPGNYIAPDGYNRTLAQIQSLINGAPSTVLGIQVPVRASMLEGATQGDYSGGFAYLDAISAMCATKTTSRGSPFGYMIYVDPDGGWPAYLSNPGFDGGNGTYQVPSGPRVPCFWRSAVINAFIARDVAYLDRYNTDPYFEMHGGPRGETDPTYNVTGGPGYSDAAWAASWAAWVAAMTPHASKTQFRVIANFMPGGWTHMDALIQQCIAARAAMGGPDVYTRFVNAGHPYPADFGMVVNGYTGSGTSWTRNGTNYVAQGQLCLVHDAQTPEMGGKENTATSPSAAGLYAQALTNKDHYLIWWQLGACWGAPYNANRQQYWDNTTAITTGELNGHYTPDVKTFLAAGGVPLNPQYPGYYP